MIGSFVKFIKTMGAGNLAKLAKHGMSRIFDGQWCAHCSCPCS